MGGDRSIGYWVLIRVKGGMGFTPWWEDCYEFLEGLVWASLKGWLGLLFLTSPRFLQGEGGFGGPYWTNFRTIGFIWKNHRIGIPG